MTSFGSGLEEELIEEHSVSLIILFILCAFVGIFVGFFASWFNIIYIWLHKVDTDSDHHGGEIVAEVLKAHGVKYIFTLVGGHISPILVGAEKLGIRIVDTRHEASAVFAADAVARLSQTVGVVAVTAGPGLTNTVTAIKNAQLAESPVLLLGGASAGLLKGRGALQDIDQMSLFTPLCKFCAAVSAVRDIAPTLRQALKEAQSGTPGPVFVELPVDVLYPYKLVKKEVASGTKPGNILAKAINWYLNNYLDNIFAGAWEPREVTPLKLNIPLPQDSEIQKAVELLSCSRKPLLVLGSQVTLPPVSAESVRKAVERLGVPCFLGGMARGLLGKESPLQLRHNRSGALRRADLILLVGTVCDFRLKYGRALPRTAKIIAVNRSREQLYKNSDLFWKPTLAVCGDAGTFLTELSLVIGGFKCDPEWQETLKEEDRLKEISNTKMAEEHTGEYVNPLKVLKEVENILPENSILVVDGGDFVGSAAYILRPRGPLCWLDPGAFGTLGVGGGFALGAKLAKPDAQVWLIYGDGSCGYSIAEIDTMVRHKLPVVALVGNDAGWTQIAREQVPLFGSNVACKLVHTNYEGVAEGYGGKGILISSSSDDLISSLKKAVDLHSKDHTVLINVLIGNTKFREGSISV
ncbi:2-hydroxyacyl-CoA lyase 2-like [Schistocerca piceifrons]|uniref:2-hydroxyacyl-CoA lyase 2-like n=1 Tax=Schistocerca piceifrons TaxID=274613 RepID=UPI001F5F1990|nr:2-hydroxyacyl-CoA lyase 2-like [Schistocerca piceifrons]